MKSYQNGCVLYETFYILIFSHLGGVFEGENFLTGEIVRETADASWFADPDKRGVEDKGNGVTHLEIYSLLSAFFSSAAPPSVHTPASETEPGKTLCYGSENDNGRGDILPVAVRGHQSG